MTQQDYLLWMKMDHTISETCGRIQNLRDAVDEEIPAFAGLGILVGQRWTSNKNNVTLTNHNQVVSLVHNGVIENYDELKRILKRR